MTIATALRVEVPTDLADAARAIGVHTAEERGRLVAALRDVHFELDAHEAGLGPAHDYLLQRLERICLDAYQHALGLIGPGHEDDEEE